MPDQSYELQIRRWLEDDGKTIVSVSHEYKNLDG